MSRIHTLLNRIIDFIFPTSKEAVELKKLLEKSGIGVLPKSTESLPEINSILSFASPKVRQLIHEIKYYRNKLFTRHAGLLLYETIIGDIDEYALEAHSRFIITYIPSSRETVAERGFQHIDTIRAELELLDGKSFFIHKFPLLSYKHEKLRQTQMKNKSDRLKNMEGAFIVSVSLKGEMVILIDDVTTTGATLYEGRRALLEAGAKKVYLYALAH
jgi:competence protein ComFC